MLALAVLLALLLAGPAAAQVDDRELPQPEDGAPTLATHVLETRDRRTGVRSQHLFSSYKDCSAARDGLARSRGKHVIVGGCDPLPFSVLMPAVI